MKVIFTGGGTAGHIFPIIAIVREIKKAYPYSGFEFFYLGPEDRLGKKLLLKEGVKVKMVMAGKIRRYLSLLNIIDIFKIPIGIIQAFYHIFIISPDIVFSKGGYGSIPTCISARILMVPIFLHESDISPGLANRIVGKFALEIFTGFSINETEYFPAKKMFSVGNPIRKGVLKGSKAEAKKLFKLTGGKPVILVSGGSQGAQKINSVLLAILAQILEHFEIIHQTGRNNFNQVQREAKLVVPDKLKKYYHPLAFLNEKELGNAYFSADLIISRAGAGSIFEIAANAKPSILVPLASAAQNHQVRNAYAYAERGAALVIEEGNFKPHFIFERIKYLLSQPKKLKEMSEKAAQFARPNAARVLAEYLVTYLTQ